MPPACEATWPHVSSDMSISLPASPRPIAGTPGIPHPSARSTVTVLLALAIGKALELVTSVIRLLGYRRFSGKEKGA
jgi:hypothetical protein